MTIEQTYKVFMQWARAERGYARETLLKHRDCFSVWILPLFGSRQVESIDRLDIIELRSAMKDRGVGIARQYSVLMTLKVFFKFCRTILKIDCLDSDREIQLPKRKTPHVEYLTNHEVKRLISAIPSTSFTGRRLHALVQLILGTGLRSSEALALDRKPFEQGLSELDIKGKGGKI